MPRVALIGPELFPIPPIRGGAAELFIYQTALRLSRWQPVVIGPADPELPLEEQQEGVVFRRVPMPRWRRFLSRRYPRRFPWYDLQVAKMLARLGPDLLHVHNRPRLAVFLKELFPQLPVILHMHNLSTILGKRERPEAGRPLPVDGLAACSRFVLEQERRHPGLEAASQHVIYNGVDTGAFRPVWEQAAEAQRLRSQRNLRDEPVVLFVGKLRESKGVGLLLEAMHQVWPQCPQAVLVLAGGTEFGRGRTDRRTPFFQQLQARVAKAPGRVILTGFIAPADIWRVYLLGDLLVGPSQNQEGLGIVFLEAAASGLPIIATRMGGIPEVVQDGVNGLLLEEPGDARELAAKIRQLLRSPEDRRRLGQQGRDLVAEHFTWEKIARQQEEMYDQVGGTLNL